MTETTPPAAAPAGSDTPGPAPALRREEGPVRFARAVDAALGRIGRGLRALWRPIGDRLRPLVLRVLVLLSAEPSRRRRRIGAALAIGLAIAGPLLAALTYGLLSSGDVEVVGSPWFRLLVLADLLYLLALVGLIGFQITRLIVARRAHSAGAQLHARMVAVFAGVAAAPTLLVAVFFFLVIQLGFEAWFNERVGSVVRNSREVALAYAEEHRKAISGQARELAQRLDTGVARLIGGVEDPRFHLLLNEAAQGSGFVSVFVLNSSGEVVARDENSFLFALTPPTPADFDRARTGALVVSEDREADEMRALVRLDGLFDAYLFVTRPVEGAVLESVQRTDLGVQLYTRLEQNRGVWLAQFAAIYLGFAVLVLLAAIYIGLWFAERLARPIGRLAAAALRVGAGDLDARVKEERGDDEIALLSRAFNRMTEEVRRKQEALLVANDTSEQRRRFGEAVLAGVTAGVIGLDAEGRVRLSNSAAAKLLDVEASDMIERPFVEVAPEAAELMAQARAEADRGRVRAVERPLRIVRRNTERELLARVTVQREELGGDGAVDAGFVVTLDDLTQLVTAQRMAAWGDVARRIAHEIKNPLTPIQLAAERLRRKFADRLGEDGEVFDRYTETIVRQTADIGRMVDAFVRFAKMPSPAMTVEPLAPLVRGAMVLQEEARPEVAYRLLAPTEPILVRCDRGQLTQALTNLLQNAADAIEARRAAEAGAGAAGAPGEVRVSVEPAEARMVAITIADNGVGLPVKDRRRLLEPYVTTREKGTGLGLAIVAKIVEEHSGAFDLLDAEPFSHGAQPGAAARILLPVAAEAEGRAPKPVRAQISEPADT